MRTCGRDAKSVGTAAVALIAVVLGATAVLGGQPMLSPSPMDLGLGPVPANQAPCPCPTQAALAGTCPNMPDLSCTCCPDICCPAIHPGWYFDAEAVALKRDVRGRTDVAAFIATPAGSGERVLSTHDLLEPMKAGPLLTIGHTFKEIPFQLEFSYLRLEDFTALAARRSLGINDFASVFTGFGNPFLVPGFDAVDFVQIREVSTFETFDLNLKYIIPMAPNCLTATVMVGLREVRIDEQLDYESGPSFVDIPVPGVGVTAIARNRMWGPQIGARGEFFAYKNTWINVEMKGAVLSNGVYRETTTTLLGAPFTHSRVATDTAFLGDLSVMMIIRFTPHITTKIGYQAFFLNHVAIAARNLNAAPERLIAGPATLDTAGDVVYHGPRAGLEITW